MVTENGDFRYPPPAGGHDISSRRKVPNPPRLNPLRINPPSPPSSRSLTATPPRAPPRSPRRPLEFPPDDPYLRSISPQPGMRGDFNPRRPTYRMPVPAIPPSERSPRAPSRESDYDRPSHHRTPPPQPRLRTSKSTSKLHGRPPKTLYSFERQSNDVSHHGLGHPRFYNNGYPEVHGEDALRSSVNSAMTSRSSVGHGSGTERSSVLTKSSSITDLSPDTPDGPYEKDGGMSVEDAISMYLDGFSDVTEEPGSPELYDSKLRPMSPRPPTEFTIDDGHTSDEHSPELEPTEELPPVPPLPDLSPPDQNSVDEQFLGETELNEEQLSEPVEESHPAPPSPRPVERKRFIPGAVPPPFLDGNDNRDIYGFRKASHHVTLQQYEAWKRSYAPFVKTRRTKWAELMKEHGMPTTDPRIFPQKSNKVKRFIRKGIPSEYRGAAWFFYAGGYEHLNRNPGLYDQLVEQAMESPTNDDKEHIERDLHRTFPDNIHFKPDPIDQAGNPANSSGSSNPKHSSLIIETQMIQSLRRVLYAFALHNPQVGYTQSLNFITGLLLLFLPEEKAFWMLHIITTVFLPGTHEISLEGANIDLWILMVLLKDATPHIYNKITGSAPGKAKTPPLTVNSRLPDITLGLTNWLMSLFIGTLPLETTLRVWDVFFYEGSKTFFRVSLAIFKACERDILAVSDPMEVFQVVQAVPKKLLDANSLIDDCFVRRHRVGQGRIEELRASRRTAVRQDKLRRSQALSKGYLQAATDEWPSTRSRTPIPGAERSIADSWRHMRHAFRGQAASYYDQNESFGGGQHPQPQQQPIYHQPPNNGNHQYADNGYQRGPEQKQPHEPPPTYNQAVYGFDDAFKIEKPKFNDIWAGLLLIAVFLGYVAVSGVAIHRYAKYKGFNGGGIYDSSNTFSLDTNTLVLFIFVLCVALGFSYAYFLGARYFPKFFIWATGILNIVFALATGIYYIVRKQYGGGIVFLLFGVFAIVCFISWIPRIPFTAFMLETSIDVSRNYGHMFLISALGGIVAVAFAAWFSVTLVAIYVAYEPNSGGTNPSCRDGGGCSTGRVIGLVVYITFAMYWFSEWLKNTVHTTIAGVYGTWYFWSNSPNGMPKGATRGAFRRATTYSFGSISFGSLIIAIINMLRQACSVAQRHEAAEGSLAGSIGFWILGCFISMLDWLVTFFNRYAFCHIALYGKPYIQSAKDTWTMMKDRGVDALVNDCLMGPVLTMGSVFVSYVCALLAYLYLQFTHPSYNNDGDFTAVIMAFSFVIGLQVCQIFMTPVGSGIETIFAAMAWDPQALIQNHPDLYYRLIHLYPKVQQAIHV
ncbi:plasma-membrane choline transporter-domain-containing protein [Aspergillus avenaceus]|uniref:Protein PNS1 n=1 Tax=Aspergillus avenaceus TaxID=36643 RepID=A0A5N6TMG8_ASPAV|nr:plasma-membrane choline transporter-domain-containing protein [Aspergillus avenaceus]